MHQIKKQHVKGRYTDASKSPVQRRGLSLQHDRAQQTSSKQYAHPCAERYPITNTLACTLSWCHEDMDGASLINTTVAKWCPIHAPAGRTSGPGARTMPIPDVSTWFCRCGTSRQLQTYAAPVMVSWAQALFSRFPNTSEVHVYSTAKQAHCITTTLYHIYPRKDTE